ncbi:MAG: hypothetical protein QOE15_1293, partial [Acidimicrobiaceae bacterium]|nr:hypothetical protein [Acidimicrobiaceae bacterium]
GVRAAGVPSKPYPPEEWPPKPPRPTRLEERELERELLEERDPDVKLPPPMWLPRTALPPL